MTTIITYPDLDLSGRGLPVLDIEQDEITLGSLPYLGTWIDPGRRGNVASPRALDKKNGDLWSPVSGTAPDFVASHAVFNNRPAWDFSASANANLTAARRVATTSYTILAVIDMSSSVPESGSRNLIGFNTGGNLMSNVQIANRRLLFRPDWNAGGGEPQLQVRSQTTLAVGVHIVGVSFDAASHEVDIFVDEAVPENSATMTGTPMVDANSRWRLGFSFAPELFLGDLLIFEGAVGRIPKVMDTAITTLKARYGIS